MLDIKEIRSDPAAVARRLAARGGDLKEIRAALDEICRLDEGRRAAIAKSQALETERNATSKKIGEKKREGAGTSALEAAMRRVGEEIKELSAAAEGIAAQLEARLLELPNLPHEGVPPGAGPADNPELRRWGEPPKFEFGPADHAALGEKLGILDFERGAKISGARFTVLMGDGARLERALINFMMELHSKEHGYTECWPPVIVGESAAQGTGQLPKFAADMFAIEGAEGEPTRYLIPTAEVPVTNLHRDEVLAASELPKKYVAYSPCFRSEAGSYGADVRGLIRQHQFDKVELVEFCRPEESYEALEALTGHAEEVLRRLELPYRVVELCSGDLGFASAKTYDIEVWLPAQKTYREISSCSNFTDFQARRARIRFKEKGGKPQLVHTLNGSGLAVGRTLVAILENYQEEDGSIVVPTALRPYLGGQGRIVARD